MARTCHAAVDLGAGSGRVLACTIDDDGVRLEEAHRFAYAPRRIAGHLRWDMASLLAGLREGLRCAYVLASKWDARLESVGVDTWGVDYGLIDERGRLLEDPVCYRDERTQRIMERACSLVSRDVLFRATGVQLLPFNTAFQLMAHVEEGLPAGADRLLLMPDLCHHALCGSTSTEHTNASTTQLLNVERAEWDADIVSRLGLPLPLLPPLRPAGTRLGELRDELQRDLSLPPLAVIQPGTHDTASAVAGTPLEPGWAFVSSGTWSLVGVERRAPLLSEGALEENVANERGVDGTFRFLKNVMGLWILESCRREWLNSGLQAELSKLLPGAARLRECPGFVHPDDPRFFNPPHMVDELRSALTESGQEAPDDPVTLTRIVLDSLALRYADIIETLERLTRAPIHGIHIVGGGSRSDYLNQATANAAERPVLAGPVEATSLGNALMQAVACGKTTLPAGRALIRAALSPRVFEPVDQGLWEDARGRYRRLAVGRST
jgi:rhamnulokinase